jgi:hypothetical protein
MYIHTHVYTRVHKRMRFNFFRIHAYTSYTYVPRYACIHTYLHKCTLYVIVCCMSCVCMHLRWYICSFRHICSFHAPLSGRHPPPFISFPAPLTVLLSLSLPPSLPVARWLHALVDMLTAHPHTHTHSWKRHLSGESFEQGLVIFTGHLKMVPLLIERVCGLGLRV